MTTPHAIPTHGPIDCDAVRDLAPLFVAGALEAGEAAAVREHLAACDDPHAEILELGEAATALLESVEPVGPPPALKRRLLAAAEADLREGRHPSAAPVTAITASSPSRPVPVAAIHRASARRRPALAWMAAAAAIVVALSLGGWNLALRGQLADAQAYRTGVDAALDLAAQLGSVTAVLATADGTPAGFGVVGADGSVQLALRGLAPTSGSRVYTAWGIVGDAAPVPLADIQVGADGVAVATGSSPVTEGGMVLALTLEPTEGATVPTLPIVASGAAGAPAD